MKLIKLSAALLIALMVISACQKELKFETVGSTGISSGTLETTRI